MSRPVAVKDAAEGPMLMPPPRSPLICARSPGELVGTDYATSDARRCEVWPYGRGAVECPCCLIVGGKCMMDTLFALSRPRGSGARRLKEHREARLRLLTGVSPVCWEPLSQSVSRWL